MKSIDESLPELDVMRVLIVVLIVGIVLQLTGYWILMLVAGGFAGIFLRRMRSAFLVGFAGVALTWSIMYIFIALTGNALVVADFFIGLLGLSGLGGLLVIIGILIGGLLGAFGAGFSRAAIEMIDQLIPKNSDSPK